MFHLDDAINEWRQEMLATGVKSSVLLDELESHLREDVDAQVESGASAQEAFQIGIANLGTTESLGSEFEKMDAPDSGRERIRSAFLRLAGIPSSFMNPMNVTNFNFTAEPRWVTYTKTAVFLAPAIVLWTFSVIFLVPKLQKICQEAGTAMPSVYGVTQMIANNTVLYCAAPILLLGLLEWRSRRWPNYRRAALGTTVFVLNTSVLALITWMVVVALLAAPNLMHHA